jgi:carbon monoxide dehydrogenase subunit G
VVPLTWKATFPQKLFPEMTGKVELSPSDKEVTRLTVSGMYEPPLGGLGRQLDQAVMHNVAEATVKELAESIAQRLEDALRKEGTPPEKKTSR